MMLEMMKLLLVGLGGIAGSLSRFALGRYLAAKSTRFPVGTFVINISGALLLGLVSIAGSGTPLYYLLGMGFLGAYTTFSTFMYEGFTLIEDNRSLNAAIYIVSSVILGAVGFTAGVYLGSMLV